jgi:glycosyltransferase involved in cell wall biosynthesis
MAARLATEKGVEFLLRAMPVILQEHPNAQVLFAGQYQDVLGEREYAQSLKPMLDSLKDHWMFLGVLDERQMTAFYQTCDVTVLPSINSTESFGLVQIESMICGTPVVASNLPGVRQPVKRTGMGKVVAIGDSSEIAQTILEILATPERFQADPGEIVESYSPSKTAQLYESLFQQLLDE